MKGLFVSIISALGAVIAATASAGCISLWVDEPEMPKFMIER